MTGTANRPRQRIPLDQAVELLNRIYDELEAADSANALESRQLHENNAFAMSRQLDAGIAGDLQARRNAVAAISRTIIEPQAWLETTVEAGNSAINPEALNTLEGAAAGKHALCRMILDHAHKLQPGLAEETALALYLSLIGEDTWLTRRTGSGGKARVIATAELLDVYYRAGYFAVSQEDAAADLFPRDPSRWPTLKRFRDRNSDLIEACELSGEKGVADRAARQPYSTPSIVDYTLNQLGGLGRGPRTKACGGKHI